MGSRWKGRRPREKAIPARRAADRRRYDQQVTDLAQARDDIVDALADHDHPLPEETP